MERTIFRLLFLSFLLVSLSSCGSGEGTQPKEPKAEEKAEENSNGATAYDQKAPEGTIPIFYEEGVEYESYTLIEDKERNLTIKLPPGCTNLETEYERSPYEFKCGEASVKLMKRDVLPFQAVDENFISFSRDLMEYNEAAVEVDQSTMKDPFFENKTIVFLDTAETFVAKDSYHKNQPVTYTHYDTYLMLDEMYYDITVYAADIHENIKDLPNVWAALRTIRNTPRVDVKYIDGHEKSTLFESVASKKANISIKQLYGYSVWLIDESSKDMELRNNRKNIGQLLEATPEDTETNNIEVSIERLDRDLVESELADYRGINDLIVDHDLKDLFSPYPKLHENVLFIGAVKGGGIQLSQLYIVIDQDGVPYEYTLSYWDYDMRNGKVDKGYNPFKTDHFQKRFSEVLFMIDSMTHLESPGLKPIVLSKPSRYLSALVPGLKWDSKPSSVETLFNIPFYWDDKKSTMYFEENVTLLDDYPVDSLDISFDRQFAAYRRIYNDLSLSDIKNEYNGILSLLQSKLGKPSHEWQPEENVYEAYFDTQYEHITVTIGKWSHDEETKLELVLNVMDE
ncbi:hypothetical protein AB5I83_18795 [Mesobacillus sp. LC4]